MGKVNYTPIPWKFEKLGDETEEPDNFFSIIGNRVDQTCGNQIALTPTEKDEDKANAAFIVKAVNSHEALLDMVYQLLPYVEDLIDMDPNHHQYKVEYLRKIKTKILTTIAQAEGK